MKRGFLLRAEERKIVARHRDAKKPNPLAPSTPAVPPPGPLHSNVPDADGGNLAKALRLPSNYDLNNREFVIKAVVTSIPQPVPGDEIQCEWIVNGSTKAKVLNAPGYPARIPKPPRPDLYQVGSTPDMGQGVFAKCDIKRGELILAERPLLVAPRTIMLPNGTFRSNHYTDEVKNQITMSEFESVLETTIGRFPPEIQADFRALHNSHTGDGSGPLLGISRTNGYTTANLYDGSDKEARYTAICKIASRINHSCIPNIKSYFKLNSFSMQFYAIRDIKAGDQLFFCYCPTAGNLAERRAELAPYGFICKCTACVNATPETDKLRNTFEAQVTALRFMFLSSQVDETMLQDALRLEKAAIKEGLDAHFAFQSLVVVIFLAYTKLGRMKEGAKYGMLAGQFSECTEFDG